MQAAKERGLTTYRLEADAGVDRSLLARWLRGAKTLNLSTASLLCEYFGLELRPKGEKK